MAYIAIRVKPFKKWSDVANATRHGRREDAAKHVDRSRTVDNIHFARRPHNGGYRQEVQDTPPDYAEEFKKLADKRGAKWRKGAIVGTEMMFIASPDFFQKMPSGEYNRQFAKKWAIDCLNATIKRYPGMVAAARLDMDEKTPHLSVFMLPTYKKTYDSEKRPSKRERRPRLTVSHNHTFGKPEQLSELQDWAAQAMQEKGYNLQRGKRKETKEPDHLTPAEGRRLIAEAQKQADIIKYKHSRQESILKQRREKLDIWLEQLKKERKALEDRLPEEMQRLKVEVAEAQEKIDFLSRVLGKLIDYIADFFLDTEREVDNVIKSIENKVLEEMESSKNHKHIEEKYAYDDEEEDDDDYGLEM